MHEVEHLTKLSPLGEFSNILSNNRKAKAGYYRDSLICVWCPYTSKLAYLTLVTKKKLEFNNDSVL